MENISSTDVLELLTTWSGPAIVGRPPLRPGGVDPLGLRQINFDLMDRCIPGLNNTATRLRPYAVVAWAWWKAATLAKEQVGDTVEPDRLKAFVDRVEVIFAVGHLLNRDFYGLLGSDTLNGEVAKRLKYDFSSKQWRTFRDRRALTTSLMAPVSYGPSAKEGAGLGYLSPRANGTFAPTAEVMPAVYALNDVLSDVLDDPCFAQLDCGVIEVARMRELYDLWAMDELTEAEVAVGRARLLQGARKSTLDLIRDVLEANQWIGVDEIRRQMALIKPQRVPDNCEPGVGAVWRAVQAQQLHRLSLEALLVWLLHTTVSRPHQLADLAGLLMETTAHQAEWTFGEWLAALPKPPDGRRDPVPLINGLFEVEQRDEPGLALNGLRTALAICKEAWNDVRLYGGPADRLPLSIANARAGRIASLPLRDGLEIMLSEWIVAQHVYWAVGRSGDETQRLRLMLDEGGWRAFSSYDNAAPTPDRLETLLSLASDAGILEWQENVGEIVYAVS